jgi:hypothetical protein
VFLIFLRVSLQTRVGWTYINHLNFNLDSSYPDGGFSLLPWFLQVNSSILPRLGRDHVLSDLYPFIVYLLFDVI